jgi:hypothetical protein
LILGCFEKTYKRVFESEFLLNNTIAIMPQELINFNKPVHLEREWSFLYTDVQDNDYKTTLVFNSIATAQNFWGLFNNLPPISVATKNKPNLNYHFMLKDLPPSWSVPGGTIRLNLSYESFWKHATSLNNNDVLFELFKDSCLFLISENCEQLSDILTGVSIRNSSTIIKDGKKMKSCAALTFWTSSEPTDEHLKLLIQSIPQLKFCTPFFKSNNQRK